MSRPDPDAWDPQRFVTEPPVPRPNRDALGQSLRAACALMLTTLVALALALLPEVDRAVRVAVEFTVLPFLLAAVFIALVAWSSPRAWRVRTYLVGVGAFGVVVITVVLLASGRS
ncbi:hypothetical protein G7072_06045 [Nocardioides sp. HDW12B]|uniref:hypothetical protein n=1 Tax=Nocardioides sp. HDW12B TaxID=2714939 RepID=UPI00140A7838|nr:hypothetical protein [Nocardioides sp. HDW12B]QIK65954.1 hypothetical protein G7072_06045 [Nocardioides sp. HDW12B]